jgi:hypothetical protein
MGAMRSSKLSDDELLEQLKRHDGDVNRGLVLVIKDLMEVETRGLHRTRACSSLFDFCVRHLGWSEGKAYRRILAARLARRFPDLLCRIESGEIGLSALQMLSRHITPSNYEELVKSASRRSKREIQAMLVDRFKIRIPLKWQIEVDDELQSYMRDVTDLMRHSNPSGDRAVIIKAALKLLKAQLLKKKWGQTDRPQKRAASAKSSTVTNEVRRGLYARDEAQCTFVDESGERCPARGFLEIDHIGVRAKGGGSSLGEVRIRCYEHNRLYAEQTFGRDFIARRIRERRRQQAEKKAARASSTGPPRTAKRRRRPSG